MDTSALKPGNGVRDALIFIPDISGFTEFVSDVEITHSQHIVRELLDKIIEANQINLEVSEIEGDAILFYRFGKPPTVAELLAQVQKMFVAFHGHLKKYETHRICHCGACKSAHHLTLKFISHYGPISLNQIKQHTKLFGKDVIVAHRLLKNDIEHHEYVMFTHPLTQACSTWVELSEVAWAAVNTSEQTYDSGTVKYCYLELAPLMEHVPEPRLEDYSAGKATQKLLEVEGTVEGPLDMVFDVVSDLSFRNQWQDSLDPNWTIDNLNSRIMMEGATHRCLSGGPTMVSHSFQNNGNVIRFTETDLKDRSVMVYTLRKLGARLTLLHASIFMEPNFFNKLMFDLFMKKKYDKILKVSVANLNSYCKKLVSEGKRHPQNIVLEPVNAAAG